MGGSKSGGGFSTAEMAKMQAAAESRLRELASRSTKVLFVCESVDTRALQSHLARSTAIFAGNRTLVVDAGNSTSLDSALSQSTFLVVFTDQTKDSQFVDSVVDKALLKRMPGLHVKAQPASLIPSKVTAYRWRSVTWEELQAIFQ
jgi:hypothetical protein